MCTVRYACTWAGMCAWAAVRVHGQACVYISRRTRVCFSRCCPASSTSGEGGRGATCTQGPQPSSLVREAAPEMLALHQAGRAQVHSPAVLISNRSPSPPGQEPRLPPLSWSLAGRTGPQEASQQPEQWLEQQQPQQEEHHQHPPNWDSSPLNLLSYQKRRGIRPC